jgi:hypothetical protein
VVSSRAGAVFGLRPVSWNGHHARERSRPARDSHWRVDRRRDRRGRSVSDGSAAGGVSTWPWTAAREGHCRGVWDHRRPADRGRGLRAGEGPDACLVPWLALAPARPLRPGRPCRGGPLSRLSLRPHTGRQDVLARGRGVDAAVRLRPPGAVRVDAVADRARVRSPRSRHQLPARISLRVRGRDDMGSCPASLRDSGDGEGRRLFGRSRILRAGLDGGER